MATDHNFKVKNGLTVQGETLVVNHTGDLSGTQVYIKYKDSSTNLMRWGDGTSGASTYRFRVDQNFKFIGNSGSGDNIILDSSTGNIRGTSFNIGSTEIINSSRNLTNITAAALGEAVSAMDTTNLDLEVVGNASIRADSALYFGITTNNYNSWKTRIFNNNTSTMTINAQGININNTGYANPAVNWLTANASTFSHKGNTIWHAGSDGPNSGLDADTLDGIQGSVYVKQNTGNLVDLFANQNGTNELRLDNNRQDLGNVPVSKVSGRNSTEVANMTFYRGSGGSSGFIRFQNKPTNAASLTDVFQVGNGNTVGYGVDILAGGLRVGGTEIIDSSRSLSDIHDITFNGVARSTNNANVDGPNFNVSTTNKSTSEYAYRVDRSGVVKGGIRIDGLLKSDVGVDLTGAATSWVNLHREGFITFYGNSNSNHAIGSRTNVGGASDDIRINSYADVVINLDSNNNNDTNANLIIGRHGGGTGSVDTLATISGVDGTIMTEGFGKFNRDLKSAGQVRATGWWQEAGSTDYNGFAYEIGVSGSSAFALAYNRDTSSYGPMQFNATSFTFNNNITGKTGTVVGEDGTYGGYGVLGFGGITNGYNRVFGRDDTNDGLYLAAATGRRIHIRSNGSGSDDLTLGFDGTYSSYSAIGFGDSTINGDNKIFAAPNTSDGLFICSATGRHIYFRTNGSGSETFRMSSSGDFQMGSASTTVIDSSRNLTNIGTMSNTGKHSSSIGSNATYSKPLLEITTSATPTQIKITTNILYSGTGASTHAHSVTIRGFQYGSAQMADLQIGWHVYTNQFYNRTVVSSGSWAPTVTLAVENNKVVIHLASPGYWPKLYVESMYNAYGGADQASGWSWADAAISSDSGTPSQTVPYKFDYGTGVLMSGGTTVIDASRNATFNNLDINSAGTIDLKDQNGAVRGTLKADASAPHFRISTSNNEQIGIYDGTTENIRINGSGDLNLITGSLEISGTGVINSSRVLQNITLGHSTTGARFEINDWIYDTGNKARFYFEGNGRTFYGSGNGHQFRDSGDTTRFNINNYGGVNLLSGGDGHVASNVALAVSGTTVIDSSRNLTNIVSATVGSLASGTIDISEGVNSGNFINLKKGDGTVLGKIRYTAGDNIAICGVVANHAGINFGTNIIVPMSGGAEVDNTVELGDATRNMKAIHTKSIKVANVEVLTSSRNLTNIGNITSSGTLSVPGVVTIGNTTTTPAADLRLYGTGNNYLRFRGNGSNDFEIDLQGTGSTGELSFNQFNLTINNSGTFDSGPITVTSASSEFNALKMGTDGSSGYANIIWYSDSGNAQIWKNGTSTNWAGTQALNIYNSNGKIAFHPSATESVVEIDSAGLHVHKGGDYISLPANSDYDKLRLYGSDTQYTIGMAASQTFGGLSDWAMIFKFNNEDDRGFKWMDGAHGASTGAMALTTNGKLTVANSIRVGYGEGDTTTPGAAYDLDINGHAQTAGRFYGIGGLLRTNRRIGTAQVAPIGHYSEGDQVFALDTTWTDEELQAYFNSSNVSWSAQADAPGGYAVYINGGVNVGGVYNSGFPYIPVDQDDEFYIECWIKNVGTDQRHYMGSNEFNQSFSSLGGNPGSYGYSVMSNYNPGNSWTKVSAYIGGFHATNVGDFEVGTKYWTPQALFNYSAGTGTRACYISGWKVIRVRHPGNRIFSGNIALGSGSNTGVLKLKTYDDAASEYHLYNYNDDTFRINYNGSGGDEMILNSSGSVTFSGNVTAYSDERLKENIQTLDGSKVLKMRGVSFIKDGELGSGVIAQELEKVAPELVSEIGDFKSVSYGNLVGYLIENAKEQQERIEKLEELVHRLTSEK